ncbi:MAG: hypothetical protein EOM55_00330 [Clostridia bacterium]|nr:hypothetical protein [Clostridia bacterium]
MLKDNSVKQRINDALLNDPILSSNWLEKKGYGYEVENPILSFFPLNTRQFANTIKHKKYQIFSIKRIASIFGKEHMIDKYVITCLNPIPKKMKKYIIDILCMLICMQRTNGSQVIKFQKILKEFN